MTVKAGLILAAGRSTRFRAAGGAEATKLVAALNGEAVIRHVARAALDASLDPVVVVTGHAQHQVGAALAGLPVRFAFNPDYPDGLAGSLRCGLRALPVEVGGVVVLLGDMPLVDAATIRALVEAADAAPMADAVVPVSGGVRGNPVLLGSGLFERAARLHGDEGARRLLRDPSVRVVEVSIEDRAVSLDVDDPDSLALARAARAGSE